MGLTTRKLKTIILVNRLINRLRDMSLNKNYFQDIIWGNKLFVNAQFVLSLVNLLSKFGRGETDLQSVFMYANAIKKQNKIKLYDELRKEVEEILYLENEIKEGRISEGNKELINFVLSSTVTIFTTKITRKG
jgi:hypothetical protein